MKKIYIAPGMKSIAINNKANLLAGSGVLGGDLNMSIKATGAVNDAEARGGYFDEDEE